ncbi:MAG: anaerobic ribonucleoside-triphosphate reductase activating protein [Mycoplasmatota bacterium]
MKIKLSYDLQIDSIVDGFGLRIVLWTQGCPHKCVGCHNPETHDFNLGFYEEIESIKEVIKKNNHVDGITLSGGEPFLQSIECLEIAKYVHSLNKTVWCYTGYDYEYLIEQNNELTELLKEVDVLVDGKFILNKKSFDVPFRGSVNQRLIDVKKSILKNKVVLLEDKLKEDKKDYIFI